ncbi:hypothetical protein [Beijerinckia indica]|uniref:PepSY domain-containing protein n=1 Tax=Beijerinckia indica subsp. indica (strain ATCC 9039 / DSM 1715 / NCIMB 8712) TaxID=395963 RepID=B2IDR3_BEII9|nr:hypothetical protein [Beijerinckia indica]ACB96845.1 hypothetical protein Bind_3286 [Beijerinckia indica subsp. indica ATCC 9039]
MRDTDRGDTSLRPFRPPSVHSFRRFFLAFALSGLAASTAAEAQFFYGPRAYGGPYDYGSPYDGDMPYDSGGLWGGPQSGPWEPPEAPFYDGPSRRRSSVPRPSSGRTGGHGEGVLATIERHLERLGLRQIAAPRRKDKIYIIAATEPNGRRHRVIFDATTGALMENRPLGEKPQSSTGSKPRAENVPPSVETKPEEAKEKDAPPAKAPVQRPVTPDDPPPTRG